MEGKLSRGFTLVEALLGGTVGLILTAILVLALVPLGRYTAWTTARAALLQGTTLVAERLGADLQRAPLASLSLPTLGEPGLLAVHGVASVTDTAALVWDPKVVLYHWNRDDGSLTRSVWKPTDRDATQGPYLMTSASIRAALAQPSVTRQRLVAELLKEFELSLSGGPDRLPLRLRLVGVLPVAGRDDERFELSREFTLRSGGQQ